MLISHLIFANRWGVLHARWRVQTTQYALGSRKPTWSETTWCPIYLLSECFGWFGQKLLSRALSVEFICDKLYNLFGTGTARLTSLCVTNSETQHVAWTWWATSPLWNTCSDSFESLQRWKFGQWWIVRAPDLNSSMDFFLWDYLNCCLRNIYHVRNEPALKSRRRLSG